MFWPPVDWVFELVSLPPLGTASVSDVVILCVLLSWVVLVLVPLIITSSEVVVVLVESTVVVLVGVLVGDDSDEGDKRFDALSPYRMVARSLDSNAISRLAVLVVRLRGM